MPIKTKVSIQGNKLIGAHSLSKQKSNSTVTLWLMCAIPLLWLIIFKYAPMVGLIIAFKDYRYNLGIFGSEWVGLENFKFLVTSDQFLLITKNTLVMNFIFIVTGTVAAVLLAILLFNLKRARTIKVFQTMAITPHFVSWVVASTVLYGFLHHQNGIVNRFIESIGAMPVKWYSEPKYWPIILTVCNIWKNVGMDSIMYYAALVGIDSAYFEAAKVDGAGPVRITWNIILPCLIPLMSILIVLKIGTIFNADFGLFYQCTRNSALLYPTTDVVDTYIFRALRENGDMGMSSATGLLQSIVGFTLVMITNWASKKIDSDNGLF